jgi:hypothetical protein
MSPFYLIGVVAMSIFVYCVVVVRHYEKRVNETMRAAAKMYDIWEDYAIKPDLRREDLIELRDKVTAYKAAHPCYLNRAHNLLSYINGRLDGVRA